MKTTYQSLLLLAGVFGASSIFAQDAEPPAAVPALESGVIVSVVLTTTGTEKVSGSPEAPVYSADFDITRMNTKAFIELLDEKYDLVAQPKDFSLVAVLVKSGEDESYRFYLKNTKRNGTPAYVYLAPEIIGFTVDASANKYREVNEGEALQSGGGRYKHAVTLATAGFSTQGVATGGYDVKDVTVEGVTSKLSVPRAMKVSTTGYYTENPETPDARTYIAETSWTFNAGKKVDLNDYPAPPAPPAPESELPAAL
jgi:hypothetical protein